MAELILALVARRCVRIRKTEAWNFQEVTTFAYINKTPLKLSDRGIVSLWRADTESHSVIIELIFEDQQIIKTAWVLKSVPDPYRYVCHFQQLPTTMEFLQPGRLDIVFYLDGKRVHRFPFELFPIETKLKRQSKLS